MTFAEIENTLPNGFHDAQLLSMSSDFVRHELRLVINADISAPDDGGSVHYRTAHVLVQGLAFLTCEFPDPAYKPWTENEGGLDVQGCDTRNEPKLLASFPSELLAAIPEGMFVYTFFIGDWNTFIHLAGKSAEFQWADERVSA